MELKKCIEANETVTLKKVLLNTCAYSAIAIWVNAHFPPSTPECWMTTALTDVMIWLRGVPIFSLPKNKKFNRTASTHRYQSLYSVICGTDCWKSYVQVKTVNKPSANTAARLEKSNRN